MNKNIALVTGAAKRLGAIIAIHLAKRGFDIILHYHSSFEKALETKKKIESLGRCCELVQADLSDPQTLPAFAKHLENISLLVNNASLYFGQGIADDHLQLLDLMLSIHLKTPYYFLHILAQKKKSVHVINMLDAQIKDNWGDCFAYAISKQALTNLTTTAAKQLAPNIRVNGIAPGRLLPPSNDSVNSQAYIYSEKCISNALNTLLDNTCITGEILNLRSFR